MKYSDNALNILTTKSYKGIGNAWIVKNLKGKESVETIVSLLNKTIKGEQTNEDEFESQKNNFEKKLVEKFDNEICDGIVALGDQDFPQHRGNVKESERPIFLYYKGNIDLLSIDNQNITPHQRRDFLHDPNQWGADTSANIDCPLMLAGE